MAHCMSSSQTVLIVEDEPLIRMTAVDAFEHASFEVLEAGNADEAMAILEKRPDIRALFTDVEMPGTMNGVALAHASREKHPSIAVIIASGRVTPKTNDLPQGAKFLGKPYDLGVAVSVVQGLTDH